MDHAAWVLSNNAACNRMYARQRGYKPKPETLTLFQEQVCDILGVALGGIYNVPTNWKSVEWDHRFVSLIVSGRSLATFDFRQLTLLVFLCHEARIRIEVAPAMRDLRLAFHNRRNAPGEWSRHHPNLDEAVADLRKWLPSDHRILRPREDAT
jgi:hypothetical protein